ncbi:uncharacterized protein LOC125494063 [Beta vulgaris subsp. vulgaris]|uniref:uncharacterized protein LOC125494063 n=1 Tax=Beta vulgaris subsp. vulgaris TaxID=3555 RepID=UPI002036CFCF|nr:uncharacterized protein LOC125494063 [Beta vulgaris subsp. vulgaris]
MKDLIYNKGIDIQKVTTRPVEIQLKMRRHQFKWARIDFQLSYLDEEGQICEGQHLVLGVPHIQGGPRVKRRCGRDVVIRTMKNGTHIGMKLYGCPLWHDSKCDFMKWIIDNNEDDDCVINYCRRRTP